MSTNIPIYYELCNNKTMPSYPFFLDKLKSVQKLVSNAECDDMQSTIINHCVKCSDKYYQLGNIVWPADVKHRIKTHQSYPSEYFIKTIINCTIIGDIIVNPPMIINPADINYFTYITLHHNKLLILDALMKQGSNPRYVVPQKPRNKYIYSEHSGVISVENRIAKNIIVSATTDRIDPADNNIYLPTNSNLLAEYPYLYHTHPNVSKYAGRLADGIIYEFPSANDVFNFVKYHSKGKGRAQASIVVGPEGIYVVRPIIYGKECLGNKAVYKDLQKLILGLEKKAVKKYGKVANLSDPDVFHQTVSSDFSFIKKYNNFIKQINLFIEYYPREKKNNEWCLREFNLAYIDNE